MDDEGRGKCAASVGNKKHRLAASLCERKQSTGGRRKKKKKSSAQSQWLGSFFAMSKFRECSTVERTLSAITELKKNLAPLGDVLFVVSPNL